MRIFNLFWVNCLGLLFFLSGMIALLCFYVVRIKGMENKKAFSLSILFLLVVVSITGYVFFLIKIIN